MSRTKKSPPFWPAIALIAFLAVVVTFVGAISKKEGAVTLPDVAVHSLMGVSPPVKRIINHDKTCAGVVRADGTADGECPAEAANLPTITYDEVFPLDRMPLD